MKKRGVRGRGVRGRGVRESDKGDGNIHIQHCNYSMYVCSRTSSVKLKLRK